jgi:hypothetical protein
MARGQRSQAKEQQWRRHVAAWRRSGQTVRAYCQAAGLSEPSFYGWRRVLAERQQVERARAVPDDQPSAPPFVPVRLIDGATDQGGVEVCLRGGRVLRLSAGFSTQTLRAVLTVLEDLPC